MAGGAQCIAAFRAETQNINERVKEVLLKWVQETAQLSQDNYCPELSGLLKSTYRIEIVEETPESIKIKVSVGNDGAAPYAVYVHEIPYHHDHGQWKFLSTPFNERSSELEEALGKVME